MYYFYCSETGKSEVSEIISLFHFVAYLTDCHGSYKAHDACAEKCEIIKCQIISCSFLTKISKCSKPCSLVERMNANFYVRSPISEENTK